MTAWIVSSLVGKKGRVNVNRICGRPRYTRGWGQQSETPRGYRPGRPGWEEYLASLPPAARKLARSWGEEELAAKRAKEAKTNGRDR